MDGRREAWGVGGAAGMKYIANGKRHQQESGARRWRPCLIKTNCRWGPGIFFFFFLFFLILTENRARPQSVHPEKERNTLAAARGGSAEDLQHSQINKDFPSRTGSS